MVVSVATPLCPAGHLPHRGGDWLGARTSRNVHRLLWAEPGHDSISPLVGEMPGRAEGGAPRPKRGRIAT